MQRARKQSRVGARAAGSEEGWRAFDTLSRSDAFVHVLEALKLEDVARLMMVSRGLRAAGAKGKDWELAVRELGAMNVFNVCEHCLRVMAPTPRPGEEGVCQCFEGGKVDPRDIDGPWQFGDPRVLLASFSSKPPHEQFSLLFVYQRKAASGIANYYSPDYIFGGEEGTFWPEPHPDYDALPPEEQEMEDMRAAMQDVEERYWARYRVLKLLADLGAGTKNLRTPGHFSVAMLAFVDFCVAWDDQYQGLCDIEFKEIYDIARDRGVGFCSDENFRAYIDKTMEPGITGLGGEMYDLVSVMGKVRAGFPALAATLQRIEDEDAEESD